MRQPFYILIFIRVLTGSMLRPTRSRKKRAGRRDDPLAETERAQPLADGPVLSWAEVNRTHRIQSGVYHKGRSSRFTIERLHFDLIACAHDLEESSWIRS